MSGSIQPMAFNQWHSTNGDPSITFGDRTITPLQDYATLIASQQPNPYATTTSLENRNAERGESPQAITYSATKPTKPTSTMLILPQQLQRAANVAQECANYLNDFFRKNKSIYGPCKLVARLQNDVEQLTELQKSLQHTEYNQSEFKKNLDAQITNLTNLIDIAKDVEQTEYSDNDRSILHSMITQQGINPQESIESLRKFGKQAQELGNKLKSQNLEAIQQSMRETSPSTTKAWPSDNAQELGNKLKNQNFEVNQLELGTKETLLLAGKTVLHKTGSFIKHKILFTRHLPLSIGILFGGIALAAIAILLVTQPLLQVIGAAVGAAIAMWYGARSIEIGDNISMHKFIGSSRQHF